MKYIQFLGVPNRQTKYKNAYVSCDIDKPESCFFEASDDEAKRLKRSFPGVFKVIKKGEYETKLSAVVDKKKKAVIDIDPVVEEEESIDDVKNPLDGDPAENWRVIDIKKWMDDNDIPYTDGMSKKVLLNVIKNFT